MPPFDAVRLALRPPLVNGSGLVIETTPAALTEIGAVPLMAPPPLEVTQVAQAILPVVELIVSGTLALLTSVPLVEGSVNVGVPAADCGVIVAVPEVSPASLSVPIESPGLPRVGAVVAVHVFVPLAFKTVPIDAVDGQVDVDHDGAALDPDKSI